MINNNQQLFWPLPTTRYKGFIFWKITNDEIPVCWSWECRDWIGCLVLSLSTMIWSLVLQERAFSGLLLLPVLFGRLFFKRGSLLVCCYYQYYLVVSSSREGLRWFVVITSIIWSVLQERAFAGLLLLPVLFGRQFFKRGSSLVYCYYQFYCRCVVLMFHGVADWTCGEIMFDYFLFQIIYFPDRWWHGTLNIDTSVFISTFLG